MSPAATSVLLAVVVAVVKGVLIIIVLMTAFAYLTLAERKVSARIQLRYGPNRVGPFGFLQPAADGVKLFTKEKVAPEGRDNFLYLLAPALAACAALFAFSVIPINQTICIGGLTVPGPSRPRAPGVTRCTGTWPISTSDFSSSSPSPRSGCTPSSWGAGRATPSTPSSERCEARRS